MKRIRIRSYETRDHDAVVRLWRSAFPNAPPHNDPSLDIRRKQRVQPELFLVAHLEGKLAGTCVAGYDGHRGWVHLLAVAPECRRRGVGAALMNRAELELAALGCPKLNLQVRASSPETVGFYEHLGYEVEERISMGKLLRR